MGSADDAHANAGCLWTAQRHREIPRCRRRARSRDTGHRPATRPRRPPSGCGSFLPSRILLATFGGGARRGAAGIPALRRRTARGPPAALPAAGGAAPV